MNAVNKTKTRQGAQEGPHVLTIDMKDDPHTTQETQRARNTTRKDYGDLQTNHKTYGEKTSIVDHEVKQRTGRREDVQEWKAHINVHKCQEWT